MAEQHRVVITGIGVVTGPSMGVAAFWSSLVAPDAPPCSRWVEDFRPRDWMDRRQAQRTDRFSQLAVAAARLCQTDADEPVIDPERTSVVLGTGNGGLRTIIAETEAFSAEGEAGVSMLAGVKMMTNASAANVAFALGATSEVFGVAGGCAAGTHALVEAMRHVQFGLADVVYTGGADASLTTDDPRDQAYPASLIQLRVHTGDEVSRPFDRDRSGFVMAEGAAVLRLETLASARARGARIYAELLAGANTVDGYDLISPAPGGEGLRRAMALCLTRAGAEPDQVGHINVHGTATPSNDEAESEAIHALFGTPGPPVTSVKSLTGHAGAAAGSIEAAATALAVHHRLIPPTRWVDHVDEKLGVDVVLDRPRPWEPGLALSTSLGLGGQNGAVLLGPAPDG